VLKPENSLLWHREVLGWINKYSGIEEEEDDDDDEGQRLAGDLGRLNV
jgi:hypothetical protein